MIVRKADYQDIQGVIDLLKRMQPKTRYPEPPVDDQTVRGLMLAGINAKRCRAYVAVEGTHVTGVLFGMLIPYMWNEKFFYATDDLFVAEKGGALLLRKFMRWAKKPRVLEIKLGESAGSEVAGPFYEAVGFKKVGGIYEYRLKQKEA